MCSFYDSSACYHDNACRIDDVFVLVFERGDIWLLIGILAQKDIGKDQSFPAQILKVSDGFCDTSI